ncbi:MAG: nucleoside recognition domain-containing protein [Clostridia bacterium]
MSIIWSAILIICIIFSCVTNSPSLVIDSITNSSKNAIENIWVIASMVIFWSGIFNVLSNTNILSKISKKLYNLFSFLFNKEEVSEKAKEYISLNIASNLLGVGNAATVNSLNGIEELQKSNNSKVKINKSMAIFIALNTASMQIIPTSMISLRTLYNSVSPEKIIIPVIIISFTSLIVSLISVNILWRYYG